MRNHTTVLMNVRSLVTNAGVREQTACGPSSKVLSQMSSHVLPKTAAFWRRGAAFGNPSRSAEQLGKHLSVIILRMFRRYVSPLVRPALNPRNEVRRYQLHLLSAGPSLLPRSSWKHWCQQAYVFRCRWMSAHFLRRLRDTSLERVAGVVTEVQVDPRVFQKNQDCRQASSIRWRSKLAEQTPPCIRSCNNLDLQIICSIILKNRTNIQKDFETNKTTHTFYADRPDDNLSVPPASYIRETTRLQCAYTLSHLTKTWVAENTTLFGKRA